MDIHEEFKKMGVADAAVLVPICNIEDKPGLLFEVRGRVRTHSGEVRYAGFT